ncbi:MAG: hypothetical protein ACREQQ_04560, partial [Candidatus Binatia bacterium]
MFEIDLKRSERDAGSSTETTGDLQAIALPFLPVAGALLALLVGFWAINRTLDRSIAARSAKVTEIEAKLSANRQQLAEISGKNRVLYDVARQEIYWSDQLRLISERLPDKVWISQVQVLTSTPEKSPKGEPAAPVAHGLSIQGGVLSNSNEGNLDVIGKFIQDLQADPRFQESFSAIHLD